METRSPMPSQSSAFFPIAAVVDPGFTTVDIAASLPAFSVVPDCIQKKMQRRMRDRRHQSRVLHCRPMAMGKRKRHAKQASMWVATEDLPRSAAHPFYARLNQILEQHDFDEFVEGLCERFYADEGRPGLPPGRYL